MIIEGNLMEIGKINRNGWGISDEGAEEIIKSLSAVPIKICKDRSHGCDYNPKYQPGKVIGLVMSAAKKNNFIKISASIYDKDAESKIRKGKYPHGWSIFLTHRHKDKEGFLKKIRPLGISLVNSPAYVSASYEIPGLKNITEVMDFAGILREYQAAAIERLQGKPQLKTLGASPEFSDLERHYLAPSPEKKSVDHAAALESALLRLRNRGVRS